MVCYCLVLAQAMINSATGSRPLERKENKRVYNLVENLAITAGMKMPKVNVIEDDSLNAFASGLNERSYTISLSRGIIDKLDDDELEGVIAHELTHIRNRDVRLLIISIIFVGIFAFIAESALRSMRYGSLGSWSSGKKGAGEQDAHSTCAGSCWLPYSHALPVCHIA
jgi:heat shock protein HtpX